MTGARRPTVAGFPSDTTVLFALLVVAVVGDDLYFALGQAQYSAGQICTATPYVHCGPESISVAVATLRTVLGLLVVPGLVVYAVSTMLRRRRAVALRSTPFADAADLIEDLLRQDDLTRYVESVNPEPIAPPAPTTAARAPTVPARPAAGQLRPAVPTATDLAVRIVTRPEPATPVTPRPGGTAGPDRIDAYRLTLLLGPRLGARAYVAGLPRSPYLILGPELLALHHKGGPARQMFAAVLRHEIAHLHAGDLWTYLLATVLRVSNVCAGCWTILALLVDHDSGYRTVGETVAGSLRVVALVALAELIARAFLRAREYRADLTAGRHGHDDLLAAMGVPADATAMPWWRGQLRRHPDRAARAEALVVPGTLLGASAFQVFLGATVAGAALVALTGSTGYGEDGSDTGAAACGFLVGVPLTLLVAFNVWRRRWYAGPAGGRRYPWTAAAALFTGVVLGALVAPYGLAAGNDAGFPLTWSTLVPLAIGVLGLCLWLGVLGAGWHRVDAAARRIRGFVAVAAPIAGVVGGWLFAVLWIWADQTRAVLIGCRTDDVRAAPSCPSSTWRGDLARLTGERLAHGALAVGVLLATVLSVATAVVFIVVPTSIRCGSRTAGLTTRDRDESWRS